MPRVKLTDAFIKSAKPIDSKLTEYADTKETGLSLRVTPAGVKSWTYRYRLQSGEQRRISLGKQRDVSLSDARASILKQRAIVASGGDPALEAMKARQDAKNQRNRENVKDIGEWYFRECEKGRHRPNIKRPKRQSTINLERYYFNKHIVPAFSRQKLASIPRATIQAFINERADQFSASTARQCRIILHALFVFAQRHEITDKNPVQMVTTAAQSARERVLSDDELRTIWQALSPPITIDGAAISPGVALSIQLAMVTLQRRGEITGMRLDELDRSRKLWTIPSSRTKNHRTHVVPLSDLALELMDSALSCRTVESLFVFPSPKRADKPIEPHAMTRAFGRLRTALNLADIRPHDLRRTGATNLTGEDLGFPRFTVSKVLNHASDTGNAAIVTGVYDQNAYLSEKRRALDAWAARLQEITATVIPPENVVKLPHRNRHMTRQ